MGPAPLQTPVRSGLPSAVRGAGAAMLGAPSGRRGVPGAGYLSHCAAAVVERSDAKRARAAALDGPIDLMGPPPGTSDYIHVFFQMGRRTPRSTLFPYTTR